MHQPSINEQRKNDHVAHALEQQTKQTLHPFDDIRFVYHSFSNTILDEIDLTTTWAGHDHSLPFYINGMTGGSEFTKSINQKLAIVARESGLSMASGSVSIAMKESHAHDSFTIIRKENPDGFVMANLGAHHNLENAKRAVDLLQANALQIHLNIPQEVVMPEGDRDFSMWSKNIEDMVQHLNVPVIVKEVGFGMSRETIEHLLNLGVKTVDVSGRGGTNFIMIENQRRDQLDFSDLAYWGQTTPESLLEAYSARSNPSTPSFDLLASGGIRGYLDIIKALSLGAQGVGLSGKFLWMVHEEGVDKTIQWVKQQEEAIRSLMLMLDTPTIQDLDTTQLILQGDLKDWAIARGIDWQSLASR
ncbi:type 2 isopentenyl-diphosphate Delta-isomerase [Dolosicoccus paucivorans]